MQLTLELSTSTLVQSAGFSLPVTSLRQSYGEGSRIEIQVVREGVTVTPVGPEEFAFVVKAQGKYAAGAPILAGCESFTWDAAIQRWVGEINYNVAALTAQLFLATTDTDQQRYLTLAAQLIWRPNPAAGQQRSQVIESFYLDNTIWKGSETFPSTGTAIEATSNPLFIPNAIMLASDFVNSLSTANLITNITGLAAALQAGSWYHFRAVIRYVSVATATGLRFSVNGPAFTAGDLSYRSNYSLAATTQTLNEGLTSYDLPAAANATTPATGTAIIEGHVKPTADGDLQFRCAKTATAANLTIKAGSCIFLTRLSWP
jgi:hypothetical protein